MASRTPDPEAWTSGVPRSGSCKGRYGRKGHCVGPGASVRYSLILFRLVSDIKQFRRGVEASSKRCLELGPNHLS